MELIEINDKEIIHIDTSGKFYERRDTAVAFKTIKSKSHKGLAISFKLKKELERDLNVSEDYARFYAICIYQLIREDLNTFEILVFCDDEYPPKVKKYLDFLFSNSECYSKKKIISLSDLRKITGENKIKSFADNIANSYRKRALKNKARQQAGTKLNIIHINYRIISEKWIEIEEKLKK